MSFEHQDFSTKPILAYMQLKTGCRAPFFCMCRSGLQNGLFCTAIWPVSDGETGRFATRNGTCCNRLDIRRLAGTDLAAVFNLKMLTPESGSSRQPVGMTGCRLAGKQPSLSMNKRRRPGARSIHRAIQHMISYG